MRALRHRDANWLPRAHTSMHLYLEECSGDWECCWRTLNTVLILLINQLNSWPSDLYARVHNILVAHRKGMVPIFIMFSNRNVSFFVNSCLTASHLTVSCFPNGRCEDSCILLAQMLLTSVDSIDRKGSELRFNSSCPEHLNYSVQTKSPDVMGLCITSSPGPSG